MQFRRSRSQLWPRGPHSPAPSPTSRVRRAGRPCFARLSPVRVSLDWSRDPSLPPPAPQRATSRKQRSLCGPPHDPPPRDLNPRKDTGAAKGAGPYSPRSLSRLAQGAHDHRRAPGAASPSAAGPARLGWAHRHRRRSLPGPTPRASPPPGRPPAALGARRACPTRPRRHKLCVRAPSRPHPRARTQTRPHEPPDSLMLSAVGSV